MIQGLAGGGLQPSSQGILLDSFPPEKQGAAMTMFGIAALLGPVVGPTLGGWLVDTYDWRWIFYINLPVGVIGFLACYALLDDPHYLKQERAELKKRPLNFDGIGLGLLALAMASWEVMLSKGQEWDWLGDPFWRVQTLLVLFVLALGGLICREMRFASPVINFRVLGERNFAASCIIIFSAFAVLYAATVALPALLQTLFGYDAFVSGLVLSPAGFFSILMLVIVGVLLGRGADARWLIATGLVIMAAGSYWMALMNLQISPWQVVWPRVVLIVGLSLIFAPINVAAFLYMPKHLRGAAVGLFALLRNEGGSFGTSMGQTIQERREQFHLSRLDDYLGPLNPHVHAFLEKGQAFFYAADGRPRRVPADDRASAGRPPPTAGGVAGLLRRLLGLRRRGGGTRVPGAAHEAIGCREGGPRRRGVSRKGGCKTRSRCQPIGHDGVMGKPTTRWAHDRRPPRPPPAW